MCSAAEIGGVTRGGLASGVLCNSHNTPDATKRISRKLLTSRSLAARFGLVFLALVVPLERRRNEIFVGRLAVESEVLSLEEGDAMPFPVDAKWIAQTEERLGVRFPASFVTAMSGMNGGLMFSYHIYETGSEGPDVATLDGLEGKLSE